MLKETVESIIAAEKQAEDIIKEALDEAKAMNAHAEQEAEKIKSEAVKSIRKERAKVMETAKAEAEENYRDIISLGRKKAEVLSNADISKAVEIIKNKVFEKYGHS
jgi:vacuolar-type H+-ATPase subunit H